MKNIIQNCKQQLKEAGIESWNIDYLVLLCAALNKTKEEIVFADDNIELSKEEVLKIENFISRRINREPVSHIINHREFYGLDFHVDANVLDPRPDSEILVFETLKIAKNFEGNPSIMEVGTGSGCLSISIAKNCPNISSMLAIDISKEALEVCKKNIASHGLGSKIATLESDVFSRLRDEKFDIIISNPPYIKPKDIEELQDEVRNFEPRLALDGGDDGLDFYRQIIDESPKFLNKNGFLIFEIGFDQKNDLINLAGKSDFEIIDTVQDLAQNDRVVILRSIFLAAE